ncbi:MAG: TraB/GumN family protein [Bacteroidetes bacterium]|nr:TraB/GumN family protein [Bacteroidota bacterium]
MKKISIWLLPLLGFFACKSAEKAVYTPDQLVPTEHALLWKISGNGLKKPSYLYGTIHIIPKSQFSLAAPTRQALNSAQQLIFEIDMKEMLNMGTQMSMLTKSFMAGGKTLKDLLPPEDYLFVKSKMGNLAMPGNIMERLKPMFLSTLLSTEQEGMPNKGQSTSVEMELYQLWKKRKLPTGGLEHADFQISLFDSIPYEAQARMLVEGLRSDTLLQNGASELDKMNDMYAHEDINAMQALIGDDSGEMGQYEEILLLKRNRNWIPVMGNYMRQRPCFFAVGSGHLGGKEGVIALLRKAGYRVDAVPSNKDKL